MREILFRGKRVDNNNWVEGCYQKFKGESKMMTFFDTSDKRNHEYTITQIDKHLITQFKMPEEQGWDYGSQIEYFEVIPETIGQFTGLLDKNGNKIFEGDKFAGDEPGEYYVISWNEEEATFQANLYGYNVSYGEGSQEIYDEEVTCIDTNCFELSALCSDVIIGSIHEN